MTVPRAKKPCFWRHTPRPVDRGAKNCIQITPPCGRRQSVLLRGGQDTPASMVCASRRAGAWAPTSSRSARRDSHASQRWRPSLQPFVARCSFFGATPHRAAADGMASRAQDQESRRYVGSSVVAHRAIGSARFVACRWPTCRRQRSGEATVDRRGTADDGSGPPRRQTRLRILHAADRAGQGAN
jgi:hypothetical protein